VKGFGEKNNSKKESIKKIKFSNEQIINHAIQLHIKGNIPQATKIYQQLINQGCNDHRVFSNYGVILKDIGKLKEAEFCQRNAIKLNPSFANAHSNLGNILKDLGKLEEAELCQRNAIRLNPNFSNAHSNLGNLLRDLGKLKEAESSFRKAIQLKPDNAYAHCNLGTILIDLGKLKDFVLLSKSTLESSKIDEGYKLLTRSGIVIANLIKGNFSEAFLNLNKTNELINKGKLNIIQNAQLRKNVLNYSSFITALYPLLEKNNHNPDLEVIPHIGESHCLSFAHQTLSISSQLKQIQPVLITGGKAWHFANNANNQWKDSLTEQIKNHIYSDKVFISFGEIDCRKDEGILIHSIKKDKDISEICEKTIKGYLDYMEEKLSPNYSKRYYFGIPAPKREKDLHDELDIKRIKMIQLYNSLLKKEVLYRGAYFVDVYNLTSNKNGENNNLYMCDKVHLSPKCLSILFENHLYNPANFNN